MSLLCALTNTCKQKKNIFIHIIVAMDEEDMIIAACAATIIASSSATGKHRKKRQWVKSWLAERDRKGSYSIVFPRLPTNVPSRLCPRRSQGLSKISCQPY